MTRMSEKRASEQWSKSFKIWQSANNAYFNFIGRYVQISSGVPIPRPEQIVDDSAISETKKLSARLDVAKAKLDKAFENLIEASR